MLSPLSNGYWILCMYSLPVQVWVCWEGMTTDRRRYRQTWWTRHASCFSHHLHLYFTLYIYSRVRVQLIRIRTFVIKQDEHRIVKQRGTKTDIISEGGAPEVTEKEMKSQQNLPACSNQVSDAPVMSVKRSKQNSKTYDTGHRKQRHSKTRLTR